MKSIPEDILTRLRLRKGILWLCQGYERKEGEEYHSHLESPSNIPKTYRLEDPTDSLLTTLFWETVFIEGVGGTFFNKLKEMPTKRPAVLVKPSMTLGVDLHQHEFTPVMAPFGLINAKDTSQRFGSLGIMRSQMYAYSMWEKLSDLPGRAIFVFGANTEQDINSFLKVYQEFVIDCSVLIQTNDSNMLPDLPEEFTVWEGSPKELLDTLLKEDLPVADDVAEKAILINDKYIPIELSELSKVIDRYYVMTQDILDAPKIINENIAQSFLKGDFNDWRGLTGGLFFKRSVAEEIFQEVYKTIQNIQEGRDTSTTINIKSVPGSGATTILRWIGLEIAKRGVPTFILRSEEINIDYDIISSFLNMLTKKAGDKRIVFLIILDDVHQNLQDGADLAPYLNTLGRPTVVVRGEREEPSFSSTKVRGVIKDLNIDAAIERAEIPFLHEHFKGISETLKLETPTLSDWERYQESSDITGPAGAYKPASIFWVALHFFLTAGGQLGVNIPEEFSGWITRQYENIPSTEGKLIIRYIAALSTLRLVSPLMTVIRPLYGGAISSEALEEIRILDNIVEWEDRVQDLQDQSLRFKHPFVALELLKHTDSEISEFPVQLIFPVIRELGIGNTADEWLASTLAAQVLSPEIMGGRQRDKFLCLKAFEEMPSELSDGNKTILHHWARTLYDLADDRKAQTEYKFEPMDFFQSAVDKLRLALELPRRDARAREEHPSHI